MLDYVRCRWPHNGQCVEGPVIGDTGSHITVQINGTSHRVVVSKSSGCVIVRKSADYLRDHAAKRRRMYAAIEEWRRAGRIGPMPEWREFA